MTFSVRQFDVACLIGLFALTLLGGAATVQTAVVKNRRVARRNAALAAQLAAAQQAESVRDRLNSIMHADEAALESLRARLPESRGIGAFLARLDAIMDRHQVDLGEVTPGRPVREELFTQTSLSFSCRGTFASLHAVLYDLEHLDQLVRVTRVSISRGSLSEDCEMSVQCRVYER